MRICIVGAGAIGGFIGTRLARAGSHQVGALARGATLTAMRQHGWRLRQGGELLTAAATASDRAAELGVQDLVVIAVKGPALTEVARGLAPLLAAHTLVMPAMNGVPWWFGRGVPALEGAPLESVDPGGEIARAIPMAQVIGCVVHASTFTSEPGLVEHKMGQGLIVGEPGGGEQVLQRGQLFLDGVLMTEIAEIGAEFIGQHLDGFAAPANDPGLRRQEADQHAQEAGLAGAVTALQEEQLPRFQPKADALEQAAVAAHAFQIVCFQHQKNREKSGPNYEPASVPAD